MAYIIIYWLVKNTQIPTKGIFLVTRCQQLPSSHFSHTALQQSLFLYIYMCVCVCVCVCVIYDYLIMVLLMQTIQSTLCVYNKVYIQVSYLTM